jgi:hypothetical protein
MYDIVINQDGSPKIFEGSFDICTYSEYILQQLYRAMFHLNIREVLGPDIQNIETMRSALQAHLINYFYSDSSIDIRYIAVTATPGTVANSVNYKVSYNGIDPDGEVVSLEIGMPYSVSENGLTSVNWSPEWLRNKKNPQRRNISFWTTLRTSTNLVPIPTVPFSLTHNRNEDGEIPHIDTYPIYLLKPSQIDIDSNTETISIQIISEYLNYQVSGYLEHYSPLEHTIQEVEVIESDVEYTRNDKFGDTTFSCNEQSGTIIVKVVYAKAYAITHQYVIDYNKSTHNVYKLKPDRGIIYAAFSKPVIPGDYMVKYTGIMEE